MRKYLVVLMILILPLRFIINGFSNALIGIKVPSMQLIYGLAISLIVFKKRVKISMENIFIIFLVSIFYLTIILNINNNSDYSISKSELLIYQGALYLFAPLTLIIYKNFLNEETLMKVIDFFVYVTIFTILLRLYEYSQVYSLFNPIESRNFLSLVRSPSEIIETDSLGIDSIPTGRVLGLMMLITVFITKWNSIIKAVLISPMLYMSLLVANRQSLLAFFIIYFIFSNFKIRIFIISLIILLFAIVDIYIGLENTRYFTDGGGERSALLMTFFDNANLVSILGNGINSFGDIYIYANVYPHNFSIELIYELGIISYIIFLFLFLFFIFSMFKTKFLLKSNLKKLLTISIIYYFIAAHLSGDLYYNMIFISFLIMYSILYLKFKRRNNEG